MLVTKISWVPSVSFKSDKFDLKMAGLNMSQGSLLDVLKKKMRQTKDEMERSKDECEELQKKLHMEVMRREEVSL